MNGVLTLAEMRDRFPRQWVLVGSPRFDRKGRLRSGTVLAHSSSRDEVYRQLRESDAQSVNVEYLGDMPPDLALAL
jgi:hypothetical protein